MLTMAAFRRGVFLVQKLLNEKTMTTAQTASTERDKNYAFHRWFITQAVTEEECPGLLDTWHAARADMARGLVEKMEELRGVTWIDRRSTIDIIRAYAAGDLGVSERHNSEPSDSEGGNPEQLGDGRKTAPAAPDMGDATIREDVEDSQQSRSATSAEPTTAPSPTKLAAPMKLRHALQMLQQIKATADSGMRAIEAYESAKADRRG